MWKQDLGTAGGSATGPPLFGEHFGEPREDESTPVPSTERLCVSVSLWEQLCTVGKETFMQIPLWRMERKLEFIYSMKYYTVVKTNEPDMLV